MSRGNKVQKDDLRFEKENVGTVLSTTDERRGTILNDLRFTKRLLFLLREYFQTSSKAEQNHRPKD